MLWSVRLQIPQASRPAVRASRHCRHGRYAVGGRLAGGWTKLASPAHGVAVRLCFGGSWKRSAAVVHASELPEAFHWLESWNCTNHSTREHLGTALRIGIQAYTT